MNSRFALPGRRVHGDRARDPRPEDEADGAHALRRRLRKCGRHRGPAPRRRRRLGGIAETRRDHRTRVPGRADGKSRPRENHHLKKHYQLDQLLSLATTLQVLDEEQRVPDDLPILGNNAYRLPLSFFQQKKGRFLDLPPEAIGGTYRYRVCPVVSDAGVIAGRLAEVTGCRAEEFSKNVLDQMIRLMRRDLRAGKRIVYDEPENLLALYARATVTA